MIKRYAEVYAGDACGCLRYEREARTRLKQSGDINVELRVPNGLRMTGNVPNGV